MESGAGIRDPEVREPEGGELSDHHDDGDLDTDATTTQAGTASSIFKRNQFKWTDSRNLHFYKLAKVYLLHVRGDYKPEGKKSALTLSNQDQKAAAILAKMRLGRPDLYNELSADFKPKSLINKFKVDTKAVLEKYGIAKSEANLSGLPSEASDCDKLLMEMAFEAQNKDNADASTTEGKRLHRQVLESVEAEGLSNQGRALLSPSVVAAANSDITPRPNSALSTITGTTSNAASNPITILQSMPEMMRMLATAVAGGGQSHWQEDEEEKELRKRRMRAEVAEAEAKADYWKRQRDNQSQGRSSGEGYEFI